MKPIIVGTDFSEGSYVALELAIDVANRFQSDIILIWARREKLLFDGEQLNIMTNLAEDKLQTLCEKYQPAMKHGKLRWQITSGKVAPALATTATRELASMIIIGTNGASGFEKYWMGSQAVRIVQDSPCPVLTVRQGYDFHKQLERIVVPIRVNATSRQKVPPAASMAKIFGSEVHILGLLDLKEEEASLRTYVQQSMDYLEKEGVKYHFEIRSYSNYCDTVLNYAEDIKADLVVINTEQDRILSQIFLGTNAQQIVHRSQIPVLCIHPADFINVSAKI
jgi:nucleotide-binding universal stress UspA family protein